MARRFPSRHARLTSSRSARSSTWTAARRTTAASSRICCRSRSRRRSFASWGVTVRSLASVTKRRASSQSHGWWAPAQTQQMMFIRGFLSWSSTRSGRAVPRQSPALRQDGICINSSRRRGGFGVILDVGTTPRQRGICACSPPANRGLADDGRSGAPSPHALTLVTCLGSTALVRPPFGSGSRACLAPVLSGGATASRCCASRMPPATMSEVGHGRMGCPVNGTSASNVGAGAATLSPDGCNCRS